MPGLFAQAVLFDDADPQQVANSIRSISDITKIEVEDLRKNGAPARIRFTATPQTPLAEIARLDGVKWIEEVAELMEDNGNLQARFNPVLLVQHLRGIAAFMVKVKSLV